MSNPLINSLEDHLLLLKYSEMNEMKEVLNIKRIPRQKKVIKKKYLERKFELNPNFHLLLLNYTIIILSRFYHKK